MILPATSMVKKFVEALMAPQADVPCRPDEAAWLANGLALGRFSVIYATPPCVIIPRSSVQGSRAVPEHLCLTRPYVPKARTLAWLAALTADDCASHITGATIDNASGMGKYL